MAGGSTVFILDVNEKKLQVLNSQCLVMFSENIIRLTHSWWLQVFPYLIQKTHLFFSPF